VISVTFPSDQITAGAAGHSRLLWMASPPLFAARAVLAETSANIKAFAFRLAVKQTVETPLVLIAEQQGRQGSIFFSNHPKLLAASCGVTAQQAEPTLETDFVLRNIIGAQLAQSPLACLSRNSAGLC